MSDLIVRNYERTKEEIVIDYDKSSFSENWQFNTAWEIDFTITKTNNNAESYDIIDYESSLFLNSQEFIVKKLTSKAEGELITKQVTATHVYYTIQDGFQYNKISGTKSINQLLTHCLLYTSDAADE